MARDWRRVGYEIKPVERDKENCSYCTLAPACIAYRAGGDCTMNDTETGVYWPDKFQTGQVSDLDYAIQEILRMQATRVDDLMKKKKPEDAKEARALEERIDRNLQKLFANTMQYRNAKKPPPLAAGRRGKVIDQEGNPDLPDRPTNQMIAEGMRQLVEQGFERKNLTRRDVIEHLRDEGLLALPGAPEEEEVF